MTAWAGEPYYIRPTIWNRWGPGAWWAWIQGHPVPGDALEKYYGHGYLISNIGPKKFEGKGHDDVQAIKEKLERQTRKARCPF